MNYQEISRITGKSCCYGVIVSFLIDVLTWNSKWQHLIAEKFVPVKHKVIIANP